MPKIGMREIRQTQLINATLTVIDRVGLADASLALIAKQAGVSTGIVSHYFGDKNGLLDACMRQILLDLYQRLQFHRERATDSPQMKIRAIIDANFDTADTSVPVLKTWLVFWAESLHHDNLLRLQRINDRRLYSNLTAQLRRVLPETQAKAAGSALAALIDGLWLRLTLSPQPLEQGLEHARSVCYQNLALWLNSAPTP